MSHTTRKGLQHIRTLQKVKVRSIPTRGTATYLKLYLMQIERRNCLNELNLAANQLGRLQRKLAQLDASIHETESMIEQGKVKTAETSEANWSTKTIRY